MNKIQTSLLGITLIVLSACGMSDAEKNEIAIQACEMIGEYAHPSDRINELNKARVKLGENELKVYDVSDVNFRNTDAMIKDSIKYSLCNDLVLNKSIDERLQQKRNAEQAIKLQLEAEERRAINKAKEQRLAREKQQAEEERLAKEKRQAERKAIEERVKGPCLQQYVYDIDVSGAAYRALEKKRGIPAWVLEQERQIALARFERDRKKKDECINAAVNKELVRIIKENISKGKNKPQDNPDKIILKKDAYKISPKKADECVGLPAEQFKQCLVGIFDSKKN